MKFSDVDVNQWLELKPYLDTVLVPVSGLNGSEEPWEATARLEQLRDLIDAVEGPFRGRVVVYPAYHYINEQWIEEELERIGNRMRDSGFKYVIIAILGPVMLHNLNHYSDLVFSYSTYNGISDISMKKDVKAKIVSMWEGKSASLNL